MNKRLEDSGIEQAMNRFLSEETQIEIRKKVKYIQSPQGEEDKIKNTFFMMALLEYETEFSKTPEGKDWYEHNVKARCEPSGQVSHPHHLHFGHESRDGQDRIRIY